MAGQLNIKSEEARTLALDLARLTGRSMTEVIVEALRTRLDQVRREQAADSERAAARARDFATLIEGARALWQPSALKQEHGELLYDAAGLPR